MLYALDKAQSIDSLLDFDLKHSIEEIENDLNQLSSYHEESLQEYPTDEDEPHPAVSDNLRSQFATSIGALTRRLLIRLIQSNRSTKQSKPVARIIL